MPRLWVANAEEALPEDDIFYSKYFATKTMRIFPRFLLCLKPGDCLVVPTTIQEDFAEYISALLKLGPVKNITLRLDKLSKPYSMVDSILADHDALAAIKAKVRGGGWTIEPFIETPRIVRLARETGVPTDMTHPELVWNGMISVLNDKASFKKLAATLNIPTVPGCEADSMPALEKAIKLMAIAYPDIMLRKVKYAGGAGNAHGTAEDLLKLIPDWYNGGKILIEPFLDIASVAGSLAYLGADVAKFIGIDKQVIKDGGWSGFDFPYPAGPGPGKIKDYTVKLADAVQSSGARGYLNVDWAFKAGSPDSPLALECNFRSNGFGYITEFAEKYFGRNWDDMHICCRESVKTSAADTAGLIKKFAGLRVKGKPLLMTGPGASEGAVITAPPFAKSFSAAVFSKDRDFTAQALALIEEAA
ncbi:MAG TPA: hypothetical protein DCZ92_06130 [Elusimicrobia bacterium]|nr:MAG: hypothetical protein A2016_08155 [Elusimicrobia bacterium GWF2_62_30]HBA60383.1 hypothetical protein [Elusimicrobiota bacterium]